MHRSSCSDKTMVFAVRLRHTRPFFNYLLVPEKCQENVVGTVKCRMKYCMSRNNSAAWITGRSACHGWSALGPLGLRQMQKSAECLPLPCKCLPLSNRLYAAIRMPGLYCHQGREFRGSSSQSMLNSHPTSSSVCCLAEYLFNAIYDWILVYQFFAYVLLITNYALRA